MSYLDSIDNSDGTLDSCLRREEKMDLIGHDGEGVKLVVAVGSVVLKGFDKKFGMAVDLEEAAVVVSSAGNKESSGGDALVGIVTRRL